GDSNYLGTELNLGLVWRFSANTAFDLVGGYLFAGAALDAAECTNNAATCSPSLVRVKSAQDAYTLAARVRLAFWPGQAAKGKRPIETGMGGGSPDVRFNVLR